LTFAGQVMNQMWTLCAGEMNTSRQKRIVTATPARRALTGVRNLSWTEESQRDAGSAPSRA
jgi:hypothetical protein